MNYAIIGSGEIGTALASHFARNAIPVAVANTRGPQSLAPLAEKLGNAVVPQPLTEALNADVILLAVPFVAHPAVAQAGKKWHGKIVIDAMNAFGVPPEALENAGSSAQVARAFPGAKIVKAFNHLPAAILAKDPADRGGRRVVFVASDDRAAGAAVATLAERLGFAAIKVGSLAISGALLDVRGEHLGPLLLQDLIKIDRAGS